MDAQQSIRVIRDTFQNSFDKDRFRYFIINLLNHIEEKTFSYQGNFIPAAYQPYISKLERIGKYSDGEHTLDILIVRLKKETSIERARSMQRNFIAWYLNGSRGVELKDASLVAFVSPNVDDWRFSLVKMDYRFAEGKGGRVKVKEEFTPVRRWSFLVGKNETSHTAQSRLAPIIANDKNNPTLKELEDAFNIETVTKEFFEKYRELFFWTKDELDNIVQKDSKIRNDFESKNINNTDFAKKLLGQIVFLYFLQKKGWFGVARDAEWGSGSKHFLRELFEQKHAEYKNFYNDILEPLFYEALRNDRTYDDDYYSKLNCCIPFLNGGLFDPIGSYDWVHTDILLSNKLFSNSNKTKEGDTGNGILDIFDRYNFTVKEDEPLEKEVAIDPEMLGKVFENLLEVKDRKSKGTYNTPREIVHYMCQQSLINYLAAELEGKVPKEDIETLIHCGESVSENEARVVNAGKETDTYYHKLPESIRVNAKLIDEKLVNIRVCDPAIGSGAFPVGMMSEIVRTRNVLSNYIKEPNRTPYNFKRDCIQNCLYGVDIDAGAVEIAKLRLWLSLVVDEEDIKKIKPLPNLDYKIVCGNSLLGMDKNLFNDALFKEIEYLKLLLFNETSPKKKQEYKKQIDDTISQITNGHKEFDFEVYFSEVFHIKKGFDVAIANPPYVGQKGNKGLFEPLKKSNRWKSFYERKQDLYYYFIIKGIDILNRRGCFSYIIPPYFLTADAGKNLRSYIVNNAYVFKVLNLSESVKVFDSGINSIVLFLSKIKPAEVQKILIEEPQISEKGNFLNLLKKYDSKFSSQELTGGEWYIFKDRQTLEINLKGTVPLGLVAKITPGIQTGCDKVSQSHISKNKLSDQIKKGEGIFILTNKEKEALNLTEKEIQFVKPFYKNSDIYKWGYNHNNKSWIIVTNRIENINDYPNIKMHLIKYKKILDERYRNFALIDADKESKWWYLYGYRPDTNFDGVKIVFPYRSLKNTFAFSENKFYSVMDIFYINLLDRQFFEKYILAILNSTLIYYWLQKNCKKKGKMFELIQKPLSLIPIKEANKEIQYRFVELVDKILAITKSVDYLENSAKKEEVKGYENKIDKMVYKLYALTPEEIAIVEGRSE